MKRTIPCLTSILALMVQCSCGKPVQQESDAKFTLGISLLDATRGHEDLTRFAVDMANQRIKDKLGLSEYYTRIPVGENGERSTLPMIQGSFDTDWAVTITRGRRSGGLLLDFYGVAWVNSGTDWQEFPWLQSLHFLRDRDASNFVYSREESLESARVRISQAFLQAVATSRKRDISLYWLGHLLHIVQDSFSKAHTVRSADYRVIHNLCTFGKHTAPDACTHAEPLTFEGENPVTGALFHEDRVWIADDNRCDGPGERDWICLKPEAQKAAQASAGILYLYAELIGNGIAKPNSDGFEEIDSFLTQAHRWQGGFFQGSWEL